MSDQLASGQRFRVLNVVDDFTRECLVMHVSTSMTGADVARLLTTVLAERAQPAMIVTDNGPEFISKALDQFWKRPPRSLPWPCKARRARRCPCACWPGWTRIH